MSSGLDHTNADWLEPSHPQLCDWYDEFTDDFWSDSRLLIAQAGRADSAV